MQRSVLIAFIFLMAEIAKGSGTIYQYNSAGGHITPNISIGTDELTVSLNTSTRYVDIIPSSSTATLPFLIFNSGPSSGFVYFYLGQDGNTMSPEYVGIDATPNSRGGNISGINAVDNLAATSVLYGGINGDFGYQCPPPSPPAGCNGTSYTLKFDRVVRFDVGGTFWGDAYITGDASWTPCIFEAGTFSAESLISLSAGSLTRVKSKGGTGGGTGDMKAEIQVTGAGANIDLIDSARRITGWGGNPIIVKYGRILKIVAIEDISQNQSGFTTTPMIQANEGINTIYASFIDARINANETFGGTSSVTDGSIRELVTSSTTDGLTSISIIKASKVIKVVSTDRVEIKGDLAGDIIVDGDMEGTILIGKSLTSAGSIQMGSGGLKGQIMINAFNGSSTWTGPITVGSTALSPSYYSNVSSSLGGGAVGLVPFFRHEEDCIPTESQDACAAELRYWPSSFGGSGGDRETIVIRHYGPVEDSAAGGDPPYIIEALCSYGSNPPPGCPTTIEDRTNTYDVWVRPTQSSVVKVREVWVARKLVSGVAQSLMGLNLTISLRLASSVPELRSSDTLATSLPIIGNYPHTLSGLCLDLNLSGSYEQGDIDTWIDTPVDVNADSIADGDDLFLVIEAVNAAE